ncbi:MAG: LysR substrate-binding domain-containing protein [Edaphobacter sp.]|uniref:LysR family transcriptional regulator n=1 Tax=Edaphobacter sp. TaxID=1934404 RepID=UPI0023844B0C|nr:LysR substrate-binding domain-containing protein [Edaphobacter sp.]MDE1175165.1 LysR substrate-binding domain-containing protein [Edaphobacter sp.]
MELRHLRYLIAVADHGSFTGAAQRVHIAQSAISEQLADLEHELGIPLFTRTSRKATFTPAGNLFVEEARRVLAAADHAVEVAQRAHRGKMGALRIGFFGGATGVSFPRLIRLFRKKHPDVQLSLAEMNSSEQWQALIKGEIHVGFTRRLEPEFRSELKSELIQQDPIVAVLPKNHPAAASGIVDLLDLAGESFVISSREISPALYDKVIELCFEAGFSPRIGSICTVWSTVILMVQAGEGVALMPLNRQQHRTRELIFSPLKQKNAFIEFVMAWSPKNDTALSRSFRELAVTMGSSPLDLSPE